MKKMNTLLLGGVFMTFVACSTSEVKENVAEIEIVEENSMSSELSPEEIEKYSEIGLDYALTTKQKLGQNLMNAITEGGTIHAVDFCNTVAIPLTDSMGIVYNAEIKRATDKARNSDNQADEVELKQIEFYKEQLKKVEKSNQLKPNVVAENDKIHFYYPILTNDLCLQCHGVKEEKILPETLKEITNRYPNDVATGYDVDEIRGIWSIAFDK